jgi:hypothetical protein
LNDEYWSALDIPIAASGVDIGNKEIYLCNEESYQIMNKHENEKQIRRIYKATRTLY